MLIVLFIVCLNVISNMIPKDLNSRLLTTDNVISSMCLQFSDMYRLYNFIIIIMINALSITDLENKLFSSFPFLLVYFFNENETTK